MAGQISSPAVACIWDLLKPVVVDKTNWEKILIDGGYYKKAQIN